MQTEISIISTYSSSPYWMQIWQRFRRHHLGLWGIVLLTLIAVFTTIGPWLSGYGYEETHLALKNQPPSLEFWFGSDDLGRDVFTRTWQGARISLLVGISAAIIDLGIGVLWGGTAGLASGITDEVLMRIADILYSLPYLLMVILMMVILGPGILSIIIALTLIGWITMARIVRGQILLLKEMDYVWAARILGASFSRIFFKHLIPNALGPILVTLTLTIPSAIFSEAFLSFLGLGIQAPIASWGTMVYEGLSALQYYPWRLFFPSLFMSLTMLAFNMIGEGLKAAFQIDQKRSL